MSQGEALLIVGAFGNKCYSKTPWTSQERYEGVRRVAMLMFVVSIDRIILRGKSAIINGSLRLLVER